MTNKYGAPQNKSRTVTSIKQYVFLILAFVPFRFINSEIQLFRLQIAMKTIFFSSLGKLAARLPCLLVNLIDGITIIY